MKKSLMQNTEGQKPNAGGENNGNIKRAVVASLSCQPGGAATGNTTKEKYVKKNRRNGGGGKPNNRFATHQAGLDFFMS